MELAALVFDVDGTLADTERDGHRVAFNTAFAETGLPWVWDESLYDDLLAVTGGKERIRHFCERFAPTFLDRPDADTTIRAIHAEKTRHYLALVERGEVPLRPGVADLLEEARRAGVRLAIATTTTLANVTSLLGAALGPQASGWFEVIGAGDVVAAKKPAPDIYRWVLERLALPATACLAIEDSAAGLRSAVAAGLPTVLTPGPRATRESLSGAVAVLTDLAGTSLARLADLHAQATGAGPRPHSPARHPGPAQRRST
jgi:beta-phosphoglucomutase-like phosphatase (HAD superfamily)